jgi:hypothetical protein
MAPVVVDRCCYKGRRRSREVRRAGDDGYRMVKPGCRSGGGEVRRVKMLPYAPGGRSCALVARSGAALGSIESELLEVPGDGCHSHQLTGTIGGQHDRPFGIFAWLSLLSDA